MSGDTFDATGPSACLPRPTLAGMSPPDARLAPSGPAREWSLAEWRRYADGVSTATERCRNRGYEPAFHHHIGTEVETPEQIERLLSLTDVGLCLDTGHLAVAGGDPLEAVRSWGPRINHVHMKIADRDALAALAAERVPVDDLWRGQVFVALGYGDLECGRFLSALGEIAYRGWIVVEQDIFPQRGPLADKRERYPTADVLSTIAGAQAAEELEIDVLAELAIVLHIAGYETTANLLSNSVLHLAEHPEQRAWLVAHPDRFKDAVEELLRFDAPVQVLARNTTKPVELYGRPLPAGARVLLLYGVANRDP